MRDQPTKTMTGDSFPLDDMFGKKALARLLLFARLLAIAGMVLGMTLMGNAAEAAEDERALGLFVGQNDGGPGTRPLLYAESDAKALREVLIQIGSLDEKNAYLLTHLDKKRLLKAIDALRKELRAARNEGLRTILYFYYSGHADASGLRLSSSTLSLSQLKEALRNTGADLLVMFLDACQSGQAIRLKGGTRAPSFLIQVDDSSRLEGEVILTSSAYDEASQESDRVGGGYFTHHLMTGLLGAADTSKDGAVTLEEVYTYAYHQTLFTTSSSTAGIQHPAIHEELRGHGTLVLTRPSKGQTVLLFPSGLSGHFLIFDRTHKRFVAELQLSGEEEKRLALPVGRYLVQKRESDHLLTAELVMTRGSTRALDESNMIRRGFEDDFSRGVMEANIKRATRSPLRLSAFVGPLMYVHHPPGATLFPTTTMFGAEALWENLIARSISLSVDCAFGSTQETLAFEAYQIPASYQQVLLGIGLRHSWPLGPVRVGVGPHLSAFYLRRSFPMSGDPAQIYASMTPGAGLDLGLRFSPEGSFGLTARGHYLYYYVDGVDYGLGYLEALARLSMKF